MEIFMFGNPRLLSGCGGADSDTGRDNYERSPRFVTGSGHTTRILNESSSLHPDDENGALGKARENGERIHFGKKSYHDTPVLNKFMVNGQWPTAGIELETVCTRFGNDDFISRLQADLKSNWFHFEKDSSVDRDNSGKHGFELITEPMPPKIYRNPRTWIGLENLISPWLESFDHHDTGLHVHVGLNQFQEFDSIPFANKETRMAIGKAMSMWVYYAIAGASFVNRVVLRKAEGYCSSTCEPLVVEGISDLASGKMTGHGFIDFAVNRLCRNDPNGWDYVMSGIKEFLAYGSRFPDLTFFQNSIRGTVGHQTEVNTSHKYTIEFRRPKGTIHSLSIHRIVELMTLIVRYAGKCCRVPDEKIGTVQLYEFIRNNTTSQALKALVEKEMK